MSLVCPVDRNQVVPPPEYKVIGVLSICEEVDLNVRIRRQIHSFLHFRCQRELQVGVVPPQDILAAQIYNLVCTSLPLSLLENKLHSDVWQI